MTVCARLVRPQRHGVCNAGWVIVFLHDFEEKPSDSKRDLATIRRGPFKLVANLDRPPVTLGYLHARVWGLLVAVLSLTLIRASISSFLGMGFLAFVVGAVLLQLTPFTPQILWDVFGRRRDRARLSGLIALNEIENTPHRIEVRGRGVELERFVDLPDSGFDPRVFRCLPKGIRLQMGARVTLIMVVAMLGALLLFVPMGRPAVVIILPLCVAALGVLLWPLVVCPTYMRVIPGRVDVLEFSVWSTRPVRAEQVELRGRSIDIDLTTSNHYVRVMDDRGGLLNFRRGRLLDPLGFAVAVATAAISTAETPRIPMDQMVG